MPVKRVSIPAHRTPAEREEPLTEERLLQLEARIVCKIPGGSGKEAWEYADELAREVRRLWAARDNRLEIAGCMAGSPLWEALIEELTAQDRAAAQQRVYEAALPDDLVEIEYAEKDEASDD